MAARPRKSAATRPSNNKSCSFNAEAVLRAFPGELTKQLIADLVKRSRVGRSSILDLKSAALHSTDRRFLPATLRQLAEACGLEPDTFISRDDSGNDPRQALLAGLKNRLRNDLVECQSRMGGGPDPVFIEPRLAEGHGGTTKRGEKEDRILSFLVPAAGEHGEGALVRWPLGLEPETGRPVVLLGDPGGGKTFASLHLAEALLERARDDASRPVPVWMRAADLAGIPAHADAAAVLARASAVLQLALPAAGQCVFVLDAVDLTPPEVVQRVMQALSASEARVLVTCRSADYREMSQPMENQPRWTPRTVRLLPFDSLQQSEYIREALREGSATSRKLKRDQQHADYVDSLDTKTLIGKLLRAPSLAHVSRSPLVLAFICELERNRELSESDGLPEILQKIIRRLLLRRGAFRSSQTESILQLLSMVAWRLNQIEAGEEVREIGDKEWIAAFSDIPGGRRLPLYGGTAADLLEAAKTAGIVSGGDRRALEFAHRVLFEYLAALGWLMSKSDMAELKKGRARPARISRLQFEADTPAELRFLQRMHQPLSFLTALLEQPERAALLETVRGLEEDLFLNRFLLECRVVGAGADLSEGMVDDFRKTAGGVLRDIAGEAWRFGILLEGLAHTGGNPDAAAVMERTARQLLEDAAGQPAAPVLVAQMLGVLASPDSRDWLESLACGTADADVRLAALRALRTLPWQDSARLRKLLRDDMQKVRLEAIRFHCAHWAMPGVAEDLAALLDDNPDAEDVAALAEAFAGVTSKNAGQVHAALVRCLGSTSDRDLLRRAAVHSVTAARRLFAQNSPWINDPAVLADHALSKGGELGGDFWKGAAEEWKKRRAEVNPAEAREWMRLLSIGVRHTGGDNRERLGSLMAEFVTNGGGGIGPDADFALGAFFSVCDKAVSAMKHLLTRRISRPHCKHQNPECEGQIAGWRLFWRMVAFVGVDHPHRLTAVKKELAAACAGNPLAAAAFAAVAATHRQLDTLRGYSSTGETQKELALAQSPEVLKDGLICGIWRLIRAGAKPDKDTVDWLKQTAGGDGSLELRCRAAKLLLDLETGTPSGTAGRIGLVQEFQNDVQLAVVRRLVESEPAFTATRSAFKQLAEYCGGLWKDARGTVERATLAAAFWQAARVSRLVIPPVPGPEKSAAALPRQDSADPRAGQ